MGDCISVTDTAQMVRVDLKAAFPETKFAVRSRKYSGGSSIDVDWTAGPTVQQVEGVAGKYHGSEFDGMIDLKSRTGAPYANDYIFFHRELPQDILGATMSDLRRQYGLGSDYMDNDRPLEGATLDLLRATYQRPIWTLREAAYAHLSGIDLSKGFSPAAHGASTAMASAPVAAPAPAAKSPRHYALRQAYRERHRRPQGPRLSR